jgi:hypothetical protein
MRRYLICRVPTVALGPTSGEVMKPQVGADISFPRPAFLRFHFNNYLSSSLVAQGPEKKSVEKILGS